MTGLVVNNKLNIISKEHLWLNLIYTFDICLEGLKKIIHSSRQQVFRPGIVPFLAYDNI